MTVDPLAAVGFGSGADAYERSRPSYPAPAIDLLVRDLPITSSSRVIDLAAGTGKLTRLVATTGADVVAVEPSPAMREQFARTQPGIPVLDGTAEAIPAADGSVDAVLVAQAFHWFDHPRALAEFVRVLVPGGGLGIIRNERDESVPWVREMSEVMHWTTESPSLHDADFAAIIERDSDAFEPVAHSSFPFTQELTRDGVVERAATSSYIVAMDAPTRDALLGRLRTVIAELPEPVQLPYVTDVYVTHRRPS